MNPATETPTLTSASFEDLVREMIVRIGEDPKREGLVRTPDRVRRSYEFLSRGYREDPDAMLRKALFTVTYDEMVIVKDIEMFSLCEHHMLPFFGKVHVAYIPEWQSDRAEQDSAADRNLFPPPANPGTPDHANRGDHPASDRSAGRGGSHRGAPSLHDDAGGRKAALRRGDVFHAGLLPRRTGNADGVLVADPQPDQRNLDCGRRTSAVGPRASRHKDVEAVPLHRKFVGALAPEVGASTGKLTAGAEARANPGDLAARLKSGPSRKAESKGGRQTSDLGLQTSAATSSRRSGYAG